MRVNLSFILVLAIMTLAIIPSVHAVCDYNCKNCENDQCKQCYQGYLLQPNGSCLYCGYGCDYCVQAYQCLRCQPSYFLSNGYCTQCSKYCTTCASTSVCGQCNDYYFPYNSTNPKSQYSVGQCSACLPNCRICDSANTCTQCADNFKLKTDSDGNMYCSAQLGIYALAIGLMLVVFVCPVFLCFGCWWMINKTKPARYTNMKALYEGPSLNIISNQTSENEQNKKL